MTINRRLWSPTMTNELAKSQQKKFNYSDLDAYLILEQGVSDIAKVTGRTMSEVIQEAIEEKILPHDPLANAYCSKVRYLDAHTGSGTFIVCIDIFRAEALGSSSGTPHSNNLPLLEFAFELAVRYATTTSPLTHVDDGEDGSIINNEEYFLKMADETESLLAILHGELKRAASPKILNIAMQRGARLSRFIGCKSEFPLADLIEWLIDIWELIGDSTHTFRLLTSALCASTAWHDEARDRIRFAEVCQEVMGGWTEEDMIQERRRARDAPLDERAVRQMADGDTLVCPGEWIDSNPLEAATSKYAQVFEIKNGWRFNAPHILYYTNTSPEEGITTAEKATAFKHATSVWPALADVVAAEVELEYDQNGNATNVSEYAVAPEIGIFPILDADFYSEGEAPYGAYIRRARKGDNTE